MASVTLVHPEETLTVPAVQAIAKCSLFQKNLTLADAPYRVESSVTLPLFRAFVSALEGKEVKITDTNFTGLQRLCEEFGFSEFATKLSKFRPSIGFQEAEGADTRVRIAGLEKKTQQHDDVIAVLQAELKQLSTDIGRLTKEVSALQSASTGIQTLTGEVSGQTKPKAGVPPSAAPSVSTVPPSSPPPSSAAVSSTPRKPPVPSLDSRIVSGFPDILSEFQGKRFSLLWRGSRDSLKAKEFHRRCDGHANTLTVISDTKGNIFGCFTPVKWESLNGSYKADDSLKSFLFTLKNPHNLPASRFSLEVSAKHRVIRCDSKWGPCFYDVSVSDKCNANTKSFTQLGWSYTNSTGLDGNIVFTGSHYFKVAEIEVFEIND
jgi:FtsZ-binding cell division protein ZapB